MARMALDYAAWLQPDHVPWEWLESLAREERPADFDVPAYRPPPWGKARQRLTTSQLLVDSGNGAARLHRLLGDHLRDCQREAASVDSTVVRAERIDKLAKERAAGLQHFYDQPPECWPADRVAVRELVLHWIRTGRKDTTVGRVAGISATFEFTLGSFAAGRELAEAAVSILESNFAESPTSERGDMLIASLITLGDGQRWQRQYADAEKTFARGIAVYEEVLAIGGKTTGRLESGVSLCQERLADSIFTRGARAQEDLALHVAESCLGIREVRLQSTANDDTRRGVLTICVLVAKILLWRRRAEDLDRARSLVDRVSGLAVFLSEGVRRSLVVQNNLSETLAIKSELSEAASNPVDALVQQRESMAITRDLAQQGATQSFVQLRGFAVSLVRCRDLEIRVGTPEGSRRHATEIVSVLNGWVRRGGQLDAFLTRCLEESLSLLSTDA